MVSRVTSVLSNSRSTDDHLISNVSQSKCPVIKLDTFSIMDRESQGVTRKIREVMFIRVNDRSLNRNLGEYQLPHIWDDVL